MFSWDSQCMGITDISGCENQIEVKSDDDDDDDDNNNNNNY